MRRSAASIVIATLSVALLSPVGAARAGEAPAQAGLRPGEAFTYTFAVGPIEGARARMSIGTPVERDGRALIAVQGQAETVSLVSLVAPVNAMYQLILDGNTLLPVEVTTAERGLRERRFHSRVAGRALDLEVTSPQRTTNMKRTLPREFRDPLSAYFALRASRLADGDALEQDVLDGAALWRVRLRVVGREDVQLAAESPNRPPPVRGIKVEGLLDRIDDQARPWAGGRVPRRTLVCWLSDDAARVLLRAEFDSELGRARLELTSYLAAKKQPGKRRVFPSELPGIVGQASAAPATASPAGADAGLGPRSNAPAAPAEKL